MFSFPVTVPCRTSESVHPLVVSVAIDEIAIVKPLVDNSPPFGVEYVSSELIPLCEIVLVDGRKLPVLEPADIVNRYLDAYTDLEDFYTDTTDHLYDLVEEVVVPEHWEDNVVPLFKGSSCATSEASIPD